MTKEKLARRYNAKARGDLKRKAVPDEKIDGEVSQGSSRKRRRLEKYIEKKLRQEKKAELLRELATTQESFNGHLALRSTASLGSGRIQTGAEKLDRVAKLTERKREKLKASVGEKKRGYHSASGEESESDVGEANGHEAVAETAASKPTELPTAPNLGSGLKGGTKPVIVVKPKRVKSTWARRAEPDDVDEASDASFDSSDSAYDSSDSGKSDEEEAESWYGFSGEELDPEDAIEEEPPDTGPHSKSSGFKEWAEAQIAASKGFVSSTEAELPATETMLRVPKVAKSANSIPMGPLGRLMPEIEPSSLLSGPKIASAVKAVDVARTQDIQDARMKLPVLAEEDAIMDAIRQHNVLVICGETGSGKTTQMPQFLYEHGYGDKESENPGMIAITQPRRVAAVSMAARVGTELNVPPNKVSYQIRYDTTTSSSTAIKFMTDGVLLRELGADLLLSKYSVVIVDEAHERTLNTDILIGVLSRAVRLREEDWRAQKPGAPGPLRLIIMSATLRVGDFAENARLFAKSPPVISVPARQHPVSIHFSRRTKPDYLGEAYSKVCKVHARLPPGGVLVFLTSQQEIHTLCRRLQKRFGMQALEARRAKRALFQPKAEMIDESQPVNASTGVVESDDVEAEPQTLDVDEMESIAVNEDPEALDSSDDEEEEENAALQIFEDDIVEAPMHILPLYSLLSTEKQMRVFQAPPEGSRLVVVATNVAETSLTIPNIRYVVDCGRAKARHYDPQSGVQNFRVDFISKASAAQRAGRAGRTGPGHCYRLFSSPVYEQYFEAHSQPEILRMPVDGIVLQMKAMGLTKVAHFPFPTPPDAARLALAEQSLVHLGALDTTSSRQITALGRTMSLFPLAPRYSRMLAGAASSNAHKLLPFVIAIVSALSVGELFVREEAVSNTVESDAEEHEHDVETNMLRSADLREKAERKTTRSRYFKAVAAFEALGNNTSDIFTLLSAVCAYEYEPSDAFCRLHFLRNKALTEVHKLRLQISRQVQELFPNAGTTFESKLLPPSAPQLHALRQMVTAAFVDQVAVRKDVLDASMDNSKASSTRHVAYRAMGSNEDVFVHPSSTLFHGPPPEIVVFTELIQGKHLWLKGITRIERAWLAELGAALCTVTIVPEKHAAAAAKQSNGSTSRACVVRRTFDAGDLDLDLGIEQRSQRLESGRWVLV